MAKTKRYINHFFAFAHITALAVPVIILGYNIVKDNLSNLFASQSVQHHGGTSDVFANDLDYAVEILQTKSMNDYIYDTLDNLNYLTYDATAIDKDAWVTTYNDVPFATITSEHTNTHLILNYDYYSLFDRTLIQHDGNSAIWFFFNYYVNYIISITIMIFIPELILYFFTWAKSLIYKFTDVGGIE